MTACTALRLRPVTHLCMMTELCCAVKDLCRARGFVQVVRFFCICLWFVYDVCWPGFQQTCQIFRTHNHHIVNIFLILYLSLQSSESCDSAWIFTQNPCVTVKTVNALLISILWLCARSKMHTISTSECWRQTTTSESYRQKCCYFLIMSASRFPTFFWLPRPSQSMFSVDTFTATSGVAWDTAVAVRHGRWCLTCPSGFAMTCWVRDSEDAQIHEKPLAAFHNQWAVDPWAGTAYQTSSVYCKQMLNFGPVY